MSTTSRASRIEYAPHATKVGLRRRTTLSIAALLVACSCFGGAVGLATGVLTLGDKLNARLPLQSPVLGGIALAMMVGLPFVLVGVAGWRRSPNTDRLALVGGMLVMSWIVIEAGFIGTISFLQPFYLIVGAIFIVIGSRASRWS